MLKRIFSLIIALVLTVCIVFQCSFESSAVVGIDDVILIGTVCLDLASLGLTIHGISSFCKSDTFKDFCRSVGNGIDRGVSTVIRNGKIFFATTKLAWQDICNWVKSKFSGKQETKSIEFDVDRPTHPSSITLKDGTSLPWADWMENPFFIYKYPNGDIRAWYCTGSNPGVNITQYIFRIWCTGSGVCNRIIPVNGVWQEKETYNMNYGLTYKGVPGSFYDINVPPSSTNNQPVETIVQYRTMERVIDNGTAQEQQPPNEIPKVEEAVPETVTITSDPVYYPGAVDAPVEVIQEGELVLIEAPAELVVDAGTAHPTLTTDIDAVADAMSEVTPSEVRPHVLTQQASVSGTVDQIIADTPASEIPDADVNNPDADIEIANKFRLPRSFLEGFPFSIPYSVYCGIQSFIADPQAPMFDIPFSIDRLGISEHMTVDLSKWDPVARLCRALLSLVWVAGLAMACGKFIKR